MLRRTIARAKRGLLMRSCSRQPTRPCQTMRRKRPRMPQHSRFGNCNMHSRMHLHAQRLPCMASHALLWQPWSRLLWCMDAPYDSENNSVLAERKPARAFIYTTYYAHLHQAPTGWPPCHSLQRACTCARDMQDVFATPASPDAMHMRVAPPNQARAAGGSAARQRAPAAAASPLGCATVRTADREAEAEAEPEKASTPVPGSPAAHTRSHDQVCDVIMQSRSSDHFQQC